MADAPRPAATVTDAGDGMYRVSIGDVHHLAWAVGPPSGRWVYFDGRVYVVGPPESTTRVHATHDDMALASPMPATVASVHVTPGQAVASGDVLVMLEAMKMELAITAPRDGRVRSVACKPGELVQPGVPLVDLE